MGDPECQILMARLASDAGDVFYAAATGELSAVALDFDPRPGVCVVIASGGYPTSYQKGYPITGLVHSQPAVTVYHAGTRLDGDQTLTSGGRVLGVTALGESFPEAIANAYEVAAGIRFEGCFMRQDIAASAT
jgi:phosphoribosylamine--glycine ligase